MDDKYSTVASWILMFVASNSISPQQVGRASMVLGAIQSAVYAFGLFLVVRAVFTDRSELPTSPSAATEHLVGREHGTSSDNPFSTPQSS